MNALFLLDPKPYQMIYAPEIRAQIDALVQIYSEPQTSASIATNPSILNAAEIIFSGWGCPTLSAELLAHLPNLKAVFYGAGSIKSVVSPAFWERGIPITSAYAANDVPVSEFTVAQIILSLKRYWHHMRFMYADPGHNFAHLPIPGDYHSTIGLISLGMIGRMVAERLRSYDLHIIAYDPFVRAEDAAALGVRMVSLEELFTQSDVVSLHTPWLPETEGMVTGAHIASMKPNATLINTARGAVIREDELAEVLSRRIDLQALLDVTYPEPPSPDSPLYRLPNVALTPHIAGSMDRECERMGQLMVNELKRFLTGETLRYAISRERASVMG